jgi:hypothetical protein
MRRARMKMAQTGKTRNTKIRERAKMKGSQKKRRPAGFCNEIYSWAGFRVNELFFFVSCTCLQLDMSGTQPDSWKVTQMPGWTIAAGGVSCQWL